MFSLLINFAELVLPSIFVIADEPDQILPGFSLCHIQYFNSPRICSESRIFHFQDTHLSFFFFKHNNQFVDSMYNESSPLSNINSSLLFRLASMPLTTQLYIHFTHIFSEKKSICYKVWQQCNHSSKVHFRTMCMRLQYSCTTPNRRTLKLRSICLRKKRGLYNGLNLHKHI